MKLLVIVFTFVLAVTSSAEDWPGFRGPTGQGISGETNLPVEWSATKNVAWRADVAGEAWSSPVVWGDRVFLTTATNRGTSCRVVCLDAGSGKVLWDVPVLEQVPDRKEKRNSYATPTPVTDGQRVYAFFGGGGAVAVDFAGKIQWTYTADAFYSQHGLGASPILYKDLLIMPWDHSIKGNPEPKIGWQIPWDRSYVLALDKNTGQVRYKAKRGLSRIAHMTPQVVTVDGRPQLVSPAGDVVEGFDPETGERLWWAESGGEGVVPSPVFGDGMVFSSSGFPTPEPGKKFRAAIRAFKLSGAKGEVTKSHLAWEQTKSPTMIPSLLFQDHLLYGLTEEGILQCMDAASGEVIYKERLKGGYSASPVGAEGRVYCTNNDGNTTVVQAGREFKQLAYNELNEPTQASLAVANGAVYLRTATHLYCLKKAK
jgi:outer membrane protein assembly factor BamB